MPWEEEGGGTWVHIYALTTNVIYSNNLSLLLIILYALSIYSLPPLTTCLPYVQEEEEGGRTHTSLCICTCLSVYIGTS